MRGLKGYYIGRYEECQGLIAATCIYPNALESVGDDVGDMIEEGLVVDRVGPDTLVRMEGHKDGCQSLD